jgi:hypothetical protein
MRRFLKFSTVVLVLLVLASVAFADSFRDRIRDQQRRINQGISSGQLTKMEAEILLDNLSWIKYEFSRMVDDGRLVPAESKRLDDLLDRNNRMIVDKKHNRVTIFYTQKIGIGQFIAERIQNQRARIEDGMRSGELNRSEADILIDNLNRIRDEFARVKRDGHLTRREADRLDRMLDRNSELIFSKKHNRNAPIGILNFNLFLDID